MNVTTTWLESGEGRAFLEEEYVRKERSTYDLASQLGTYPNMIRRALQFHSFMLRSKSKAQSAALRSGRHPHPTEGKGHNDEARSRISSSVSESWFERKNA